LLPRILAVSSLAFPILPFPVFPILCYQLLRFLASKLSSLLASKPPSLLASPLPPSVTLAYSSEADERYQKTQCHAETYNFMYPYYFSALLHHLLTAKVKKLSTLCTSPYHLLLLKEQLSFPVGPYAKLFTFLRASRFIL